MGCGDQGRLPAGGRFEQPLREKGIETEGTKAWWLEGPLVCRGCDRASLAEGQVGQRGGSKEGCGGPGTWPFSCPAVPPLCCH
jgi:hypothetical protein